MRQHSLSSTKYKKRIRLSFFIMVTQNFSLTFAGKKFALKCKHSQNEEVHNATSCSFTVYFNLVTHYKYPSFKKEKDDM